MKKSLLAFSILLLSLIMLTYGLPGAADRTPRVTKIEKTDPIKPDGKAAVSKLSASDFCYIYHGGEPAWYVFDWVINDDLYKAYQDPSLACENPYPFTIDSIHFLVGYRTQGHIMFQVDIESIDDSEPNCPRPGEIIAIHPPDDVFGLELDTFLYAIDVPLDPPVTVNGPYFVGLYFVDIAFQSAVNLVTDDTPVPCVSYNIWESDGTFHLDDVDTIMYEGQKVFPGRIVLYSSGRPGGSSGGGGGDDDTTAAPVPAARLLEPTNDSFQGDTIDLWADDAAGSQIIDYARFQYYHNSHWIDIGTDFNDNPPLRNSLDPSGYGDGLSYKWITSYVDENQYPIRVIIADTLGRTDTSSSAAVYIDPTPPFPRPIVPDFGDRICSPFDVSANCGDQDISFMSFDLLNMPADLTLPIPVINQTLGGDTDGDPYDNNPAAEGEFGDYCCGPAAAAMAIKYWFNRDDNYIFLMREGTTILSDDQLMSRLFQGMHIEDNNGCYDEDFVNGLNQYLLIHGDQFELTVDRYPALANFISLLVGRDNAVMLGLSGEPGLWLTAAGLDGYPDRNGVYTADFADPVFGYTRQYRLKQENGKLWLEYGPGWMAVDIMVGLAPYNWTVSFDPAGLDMNGADGWGFWWDPASLMEDSLYLLKITATDNSNHSGDASVPVRKDCDVTFIPGDVNYDNSVNSADIVYLINFLYDNGPAPPAGNTAADINCDNFIDMADIVFLYKYIFASGPPPCAHK